MKLTASQVKWIEEIEADRRALENTLRVALSFHANSANELAKREAAMWTSFSEIYDFDLTEAPGWTVANVEGAITIVQAEKPE